MSRIALLSLLTATWIAGVFAASKVNHRERHLVHGAEHFRATTAGRIEPGSKAPNPGGSNADSEDGYLYFDSEDRPLNLRADGTLEPIAGDKLSRAVARSWISIGQRGDRSHSGAGAFCSIPEPWEASVSASSASRTTER